MTSSDGLDPGETQRRIDELVSEADTIRQATDEAIVRGKSLEGSLSRLESEQETLLQQDATPATDALLELVKQIELLHQFTQDQESSSLSVLEVSRSSTPLVRACKSQCHLVFDQFQSLNDKAKGLMQGFTELSTDFTHEISLTQTRMDKLRDLQEMAKSLRDGIENERKNLNDQKETAEAHVERARSVVRSAENMRKSMKDARTIRNVLTLGIGKALDLFDLEKDMKLAEQTIESSRKNLQERYGSMRRALVALRRIDEEIMFLGMLGGSVRDQSKELQQSIVHCQGLRARTIDLANASLDVSLFVGYLAAKSETLEVNNTSQQFARGVLNFGKVMASEERFNKLLVQDTTVLQSKLDMIAQYDFEDRTRAIGDIM